MMRYVEPIILAEEYTEPTKERTVTVYKNEVYKDIDLYTHKHVDASESQNQQARNAVSSDSSEDVDSAVIARYVAFRDAYLRSKIQFALSDKVQVHAADPITLEDNRFIYDLALPMAFNDNTLRPLAEFFHRFLVFGALYDWYSQFGMAQQASYYARQMDSLEETINSALRGSSVVKRPMQPFGPAAKIR